MIKILFNFVINFFNLKIIRFLSINNPNITIINFKKKKVIKIKFFALRKKLTQNEFDGYNWYQKKDKFNSQLKKFYFFGICGIQLNVFAGKKINYLNSFSKNLKYIKKIIKYYRKIWPINSTYSPAHGDFTFDNIIFNKNNIKLIDWEFFKKKEINNYDLVYFFLSTIILPNLNKNKVSNIEEKKIIKIWKLIKKNINNEYLKSRPIDFFIKKINHDNHWCYLNFYFKKKFFLSKAKPVFLSYLKQILHY